MCAQGATIVSVREQIEIKDGRVATIRRWWGRPRGSSVLGETLTREENGVHVVLADAETGGAVRLVVPIARLREDRVRRAFSANPVNVDQLRTEFPGHQIIE